MKRIVALSLLGLMACKKDNTPTLPNINYAGNWSIVQTINQVYTLDEAGDTSFTVNQTTNFASGAGTINFNIDNSGNGSAVIAISGQATDSMRYVAISHGYFRLDSTLCQVNSISDSTFSFNTLDYRNSPNVPGRIQVTQDFFSLSK